MRATEPRQRLQLLAAAANVAVGYVGLNGGFTILEDEKIAPYVESVKRTEGAPAGDRIARSKYQSAQVGAILGVGDGATADQRFNYLNAPTPALLDACDRLGMLVWDENHRNGQDGELTTNQPLINH